MYWLLSIHNYSLHMQVHDTQQALDSGTQHSLGFISSDLLLGQSSLVAAMLRLQAHSAM